MKKLFLVLFLCTVLLCGCLVNGEKEISETAAASADVTAETSAKAETITTTVAAVTEGTTTAEKTVDTSGVDFIKESLQAEWNDSISLIDMYTADLNGDGVVELLVNYTLGIGKEGLVYVYDVSDGMKQLYKISARTWDGKLQLYKDENEKAHIILQANYTGAAWEENYAYFDITHESITMPFYDDIHGWFNGGAHIFDDNIYIKCEVVPFDEENDRWRNFDSEKAEFLGTYDRMAINKAIRENEDNEISRIIQKEVFEGLTYVSDVEELCRVLTYKENGRYVDMDIEYFWQNAARVLAEIYGDVQSAATD